MGRESAPGRVTSNHLSARKIKISAHICPEEQKLCETKHPLIKALQLLLPGFLAS
jgi:hypothetical protein